LRVSEEIGKDAERGKMGGRERGERRKSRERGYGGGGRKVKREFRKEGKR
jgi:hypothetical protein